MTTIVEREETLEDTPVEQPVSNLPFIITLVALTICFAFQTLQLATERSNLGSGESQSRCGDAGSAKSPGAV